MLNWMTCKMRVHFKRYIYFIFLIWSLVLFLTIWIIKLQERGGHPRVEVTRSNDSMTIISYYGTSSNREWDINCVSHTCHVTTDHEARHQHDILGVIFYGSTFGGTGLPLPRRPGHIWGLFHEESPRNNAWLFCASGAMELFNLTATFREESHYPFPTMFLQDENELTNTEFVVSISRKNELRRQGLAPIVFVHMDCQVPSDRSHYMRLLSNYIKVDSFGICEHNKDFPSEKLKKGWTSRAFYKFLSDYKFAFAIENAVCEDYITEKFWRPLHIGVVPLVFGSPTVKDFAPENHSIIDVRDFHSVKEVAEYITFLDTHDDEYLKYLDFKRNGIRNNHLSKHLKQRDFGTGNRYVSHFAGFECFVCEKLHEYKSRVSFGLPKQTWQGGDNHYNCPEPRGFDEEGRYVVKKPSPFVFARFYLKALRYHIENNFNADVVTIKRYARALHRRFQHA